MGIELDELIIRITERGFAALQQKIASTETAITRAQGRILAFEAALNLVGRGFRAGQTVARELAQIADAGKALEGRLKLVAGSTEAARSAMAGVQGVARDSRSDLQATGTLYLRLANSTKEMGVSQERLLGITSTVNKAIAIGGSNAQEAQAGLIQFSQGLAAGALRGEEFNSVMEQTPGLASVLAEGLGVPISRLRSLAFDGKLTADAIVSALERMAGSVDQRFKGLPATIGQSMMVAQNAVVQAIQDIDRETGVSTQIADRILEMADAATRWAAANNDMISNEVETFFDGLDRLLPKVAEGLTAAASAAGEFWAYLKPIGSWVTDNPEAAGWLAAALAFPATRGPALLTLSGMVAAGPVGADLDRRGYKRWGDISPFSDATERDVVGKYGRGRLRFGDDSPEVLSPEQEYARRIAEYDRREQSRFAFDHLRAGLAAGYLPPPAASYAPATLLNDVPRESEDQRVARLYTDPYRQQSTIDPATQRSIDRTRLASEEAAAREAKRRARQEEVARLATAERTLQFDEQFATGAGQVQMAILERALDLRGQAVQFAQEDLALAQQHNASTAEQIAYAQRITDARVAELEAQRSVVEEQLRAGEEGIRIASESVEKARQLGLSKEDVLEKERALKLLMQEQPAEAEKLRGEIERINAAIDRTKAGVGSVASELRRAADSAALAIIASVDPMESLRQGLEEFDRTAAASGVQISAEVRQKYTDKLIDDFRRAAEGGEDMFDRLEGATQRWGESFTNTLAEGKGDFSDFARSLLVDMNKMLIAEFVTEPIFGRGGIMHDFIGTVKHGSNDEIERKARERASLSIQYGLTAPASQANGFVGPPAPSDALRDDVVREAVEGPLRTAGENIETGWMATLGRVDDAFMQMVSGVGDSFLTIGTSLASIFLGGKSGSFWEAVGMGALSGAIGGAVKGAAGAFGGGAGLDTSTSGLTPDAVRGGSYAVDDFDTRFRFHDGGWVNARRFHDGGMAGLAQDEVPAVLQTGEYVMSRDEVRRSRKSNSSASNVVVNVPTEIHVRAFDSKDVVRVLSEQKQTIEGIVQRAVKKGGAMAKAVGRRT